MTSLALAPESPSTEPSPAWMKASRLVGHRGACVDSTAQTYHHYWKRSNSEGMSHWGSAVSFSNKGSMGSTRKQNKQESLHKVTVPPRYSSYPKGCNKKKRERKRNYIRTLFYFKETDYNPHTRALPITTQGKLKGSHPWQSLLKTLVAPAFQSPTPHPIRRVKMYSHPILNIYKKLNWKSELSFISFSFSLEPTPMRFSSPILHWHSSGDLMRLRSKSPMTSIAKPNEHLPVLTLLDL